MASDPKTSLARSTAIVHVPREDCFPMGLFCASPTVLEAINEILQQQGLRPLWVQPDGTIGPTDPLLLCLHYSPSPFVC